MGKKQITQEKIRVIPASVSICDSDRLRRITGFHGLMGEKQITQEKIRVILASVSICDSDRL